MSNLRSHGKCVIGEVNGETQIFCPEQKVAAPVKKEVIVSKTDPAITFRITTPRHGLAPAVEYLATVEFDSKILAHPVVSTIAKLGTLLTDICADATPHSIEYSATCGSSPSGANDCASSDPEHLVATLIVPFGSKYVADFTMTLLGSRGTVSTYRLAQRLDELTDCCRK
jgi:hypothetical protein